MSANLEMPKDTSAIPSAQYLNTRQAMVAMAMSTGRRMLDAPLAHVCVMAAYAGALIAAGALFSVLLSAGVETQGPRRLLEGLGFTAGFFFVILAQAALFTEINVVMPVTLLHYSKATLVAKAMRFWIVAFAANMVGAMAVGYLVANVQHYPSQTGARLAEIIAGKMAYREIGGAAGWLQAVLSGMLANWFVGLAALFATMGRTVIDKFIPLFLAVSLFDAAGFQHSPANMAYFRWPRGRESDLGGGQRWAGASFRQPSGISSAASCSSPAVMDYLRFQTQHHERGWRVQCGAGPRSLAAREIGREIRGQMTIFRILNPPS